MKCIVAIVFSIIIATAMVGCASIELVQDIGGITPDKSANLTIQAEATASVEHIATDNSSLKDDSYSSDSSFSATTDNERCHAKAQLETENIIKETASTAAVAQDTFPSETNKYDNNSAMVDMVTTVPIAKETKSNEPVIEPTEEKVDICYYLDCARSYATSIGLAYDETATDCWDNPISINADLTNIAENIESRLRWYKTVEGFEAVCFWYESAGENRYLFYIGYA